MKAVHLDLLMVLPWLPLLGAVAIFVLARLSSAGTRAAVAAVVAVVTAVVAGQVLLRMAAEGSFQYLAAGGFVGARFSADLAPALLRPFVPLVLEPLTAPALFAVAVVGGVGVLGLAAGHGKGVVSGAAVGAGLLIEGGTLLLVLVDKPAHLVAAFALVGVIGATAPVFTARGRSEGLVKVFAVQRLGDACLVVALLCLSASLGSLSFEAILAGAPSIEPWDRLHGGAFDGTAHRTLWFVAGTGVAIGAASRGGILCWPFLRDATSSGEVAPPLAGLVHGLAFHGSAAILLLRLHPVIALSPEVQDGLVVAGVATLVLVGPLALAGRDLLRLDAHLLAAFSGVIAVCAGTQDVAGVALGGLFVLAAGLGLPWSFAAVVDAVGDGKRDPLELGGLEPKIPRTHSTRLLLTAGIATLPPFCGFVVVERALEAAVLSSRVDAVVVVALCVGVVVTGAAAWRALHLVFTGKPRAALTTKKEPSLSSTAPALLLAFVAPALSLLAIPNPLLQLSPVPLQYDPVLPSFMAPSLLETDAVRHLFWAKQVAPSVPPSTFGLLVLGLGVLPWLVSLVLWRKGPRFPGLAGSFPARWLARLAGQDSAVARSVQESVERLSRLLAVNLVPAALSLLLQRLPQAVGAVVAFVVRVTQNGGAQLAFVIALLALAGLLWQGTG